MLPKQLFWKLFKKLFPEKMGLYELGKYVKDLALPVPYEQSDSLLPSTNIGTEGIDLQVENQLNRLTKWKTDKRYSELYNIIRSDDKINIRYEGQNLFGFGTGLIRNGYYPTPDAEIYASMIIDLTPDQIIEIGSGFSTLIARHSINFAGLNTHLQVIDPRPRTDVESATDDIVYDFIENYDFKNTDFGKKTILFIDSSHICRVRGDVPAIYCRILPSLPSGVVVHAHDIYLPYDYPAVYDDKLWTEQYLLHCLLANSDKYEMLLATHYLSRYHAGKMQSVFGSDVGCQSPFCGASMWLVLTDFVFSANRPELWTARSHFAGLSRVRR